MTTTATPGAQPSSPLRGALDSVIAEKGCSMQDLTVLAAKNDPFRIDTPARHRDGRWLADTAAELGLGDRRIHLRGLHYMILGRPSPGDGSPSTPLKATEKRADPWREAMGVEQTEIDALASLRPDLLRQVADEAIKPFFDETLEQRVHAAQRRWTAAARTAVEQAEATEELEAIRAEAAEQLENMRRQVNELNAALWIDPADIRLPPWEIPSPELGDGEVPAPLIDSRWPFAEQCARLIASKSYT